MDFSGCFMEIAMWKKFHFRVETWDETEREGKILRNNFSFEARHMRLEPIELIKLPARTLSHHKKLAFSPPHRE